jgi:tRNA(fMet)-specific endonuclease VapC
MGTTTPSVRNANGILVTYLLDTDTCIEWIRGKNPKVVARMKLTNPCDLRLSTVVLAELWYGCERLKPDDRIANRNLIESLRGQVMVLPFDELAAEYYAIIRADLTAKGTPIGPNDLLIAATAQVNGCTLVTHNTGEFSRIAGLRLDDWTL